MLGSVTFVAHSQRRSRRAALVGLAAFIGVTGALSLSLIAGARRSSSVVDLFIGAAPKYDATVVSSNLTQADIQALPGVERADPSGYVATNVVDARGEVISGVDGGTMDFTAPKDPTLRVLAGAMPDGKNPLEVVVNDLFANYLHTKVGDRVRVRMYGLDQSDSVSQGVYTPTGPIYEVTITAEVRPPIEIAADEARRTGTQKGHNLAMLFSSGFWEQHHSEFLEFGQQYFLVLADGIRGVPAVSAALAAVSDPQTGAGGELAPDERFSHRASFATPVDLETTALLALGIGLAIAALATLALLLRAEQRIYERDTMRLSSMGLTSGQLNMVAAARTLPASLVGGAVAVAGAFALSSRFPIGVGRRLELDQGLQFNVTVLLLGALVSVCSVATLSVLLSRPRRRQRFVPTTNHSVPGWLRRTGVPNEVALGAHLAFEGAHGRRSGLTTQGIAGGVTALMVAATFGIWLGGVDRLYESSARHGWPWDVAIGNTNFALSPSETARLAADRRLAEQTPAKFGQATLGGRSTELFAFDSAGNAPPMIVDGRLPVAANEVAIGTILARQLGVRIGDKVTMSLADSEFLTEPAKATPDTAMTMVGTALAPVFGDSDVGVASVVTLDAIRAAGGDADPRLVMARLVGSDHSAMLDQLNKDYTEDKIIDIIPARIANMHRVRSVPLLGVGLAVSLAMMILAYVIVAGVRSHRRELAVLRAMGLDTKQLRTSVLWKGALTNLIMLAIGLPLGLVAGIQLWRRVASDTGVQPGAVVPPLTFVAIPASFAVAATASLVAARRANRSNVTTLLLEE